MRGIGKKMAGDDELASTAESRVDPGHPPDVPLQASYVYDPFRQPDEEPDFGSFLEPAPVDPFASLLEEPFIIEPVTNGEPLNQVEEVPPVNLVQPENNLVELDPRAVIGMLPCSLTYERETARMRYIDARSLVREAIGMTRQKRVDKEALRIFLESLYSQLDPYHTFSTTEGIDNLEDDLEELEDDSDEVEDDPEEDPEEELEDFDETDEEYFADAPHASDDKSEPYVYQETLLNSNSLPLPTLDKCLREVMYLRECNLWKEKSLYKQQCCNHQFQQELWYWKAEAMRVEGNKRQRIH